MIKLQSPHKEQLYLENESLSMEGNFKGVDRVSHVLRTKQKIILLLSF